MLVKIKNFFKDWNLYEYIYLTLAFGITLTLTIVFKSGILSFFSTFLTLLTALLTSKAKWYTYIVGILAIALYAIISFSNSNYGETLLSIIITIPMYAYSLYTWLKNIDDKSNVKVNKISKKELIIVLLCQIPLFIGFYFLLNAFHTPVLIVATFSILTKSLALYFLLRRSFLGFICFIINDILAIIIWLTPVIGGNLSLLSTLFLPVMLLVSDVYSIINWLKISKNQKKENIQIN